MLFLCFKNVNMKSKVADYIFYRICAQNVGLPFIHVFTLWIKLILFSSDFILLTKEKKIFFFISLNNI